MKIIVQALKYIDLKFLWQEVRKMIGRRGMKFQFGEISQTKRKIKQITSIIFKDAII